ncbi:MAG: carbohydrate binding domain-containing protein [Patescibacteria group bacterium]|jgi:hypothetical protein
MKICQVRKKFINYSIVLFLFFLLMPLTYVKADNVIGSMFGSKLKCESVDDNSTANAGDSFSDAAGQAITVFDQKTNTGIKRVQCIDQRNGVERAMDWVAQKAMTEWKWALEKGAAQAYKAALSNFLNTLAVDTATYLATGDEGQSPMFETDNIGDYLVKVGDSAAGAFLEDLGKNGPVKFNLCTPNPSVMLKINLGLQRGYKPKAPQCSFSKLVDNWDAALKDKDFLPKFQDMFNPWSNDLGIALTLQTGMAQSIEKEKTDKGANYYITQGIHAVTDPISGKQKTPAIAVSEQMKKTINEANENFYVYTGDAVADAIGLFANTLIGKLMDEWLNKGLVTNFPNSSSSSSLTDADAQNESGGITEAGDRFKKLSEPNFKVRGDYDILNELTMCPDPNKAGPTNCVIDQKFREAIEKRLTVKQAMDQGYLNPNGIFGFTSDGLEPNYNQGYPYRSMLILRKFRILPVGWEVAAQKIKDHQESPSGTKNLRDLVDCFYVGGWCKGLVDPNWVLKAPQNYCAKEGAGSEIMSQEISGEGINSSINILRNDTYCADEQSCVKEKSDGSCQLYGYCTEEKRAWDFNGKSCEPRENTCQTFKLGENTFSYLQNTLDYSICNASNAGCKRYVAGGVYDTYNKSVNWDETSSQIYLNKSAEVCQAEDEGCHAFIRLTPDQGETYANIRNAGVNAAYNRFASTGLIYEKLLPDYLKSSCYSYGSGGILDGTLKSDAPAACSKFVRECKAEEAGCELYTSAADDSEVPAKVSAEDYCPAECVNYDTYVQKETAFDLSRDAYFIPKTAKKCSAEAVGCSQFTNLDEVSRGGEGVEYYTYLRQCLKKTGNESSCGEFYSWEGSDESGYQLKVESLKASGAEPAVTEPDASLCNEAIYNLSPSNPAYNVDCRQFYNREGGLSYHLYRNTVSCSDDCHPYRKTLAVDDTALACKGGVWDGTEKSCVYMAIPGQGAKCSATQNGCREYTGNMGNDIRNIFTDDFSGGTTANWVGVNGATVTPSNEAINLDSNNKGNSLYISGGQFSTSRLVGSSVTTGKSYVLSFVAKASAPTALNLSLTNSSGAKANFAPVSLTIDWQIFQTNLADLDHIVTADEILLLAAGQNFYIDNITLTEIVDRYYLIKDSWRTPASCDSDQSGAPYALYMLGCGKYADRNNKTHYLKSFTELCSESAVGCELMIDTKNSTATTTETFVNSGTTKTVLADSFTYVVYDKDKLCSSQDKGCSLLGQAYEYENNTLYSDVYIRNNPDKYNTILCGDDAVGCEAFTYDKGEKYFKDPGDQICEWRKGSNAGDGYRWYKKKVKRCGNTSDICLSDNDCVSGTKCQVEAVDIACTVSDTKTLGLGGVGSRVSQPTADTNGYWVGVCSGTNSGCTEYIDPISKFNSNIIFNGDFQSIAGSITSGWSSMTQSVALTANTVYRLSGPLRLESCSGGTLHIIDSNNNLSGAVSSISAPATFYYAGALQGSCMVRATATQPVELKPVVIDYQLKQDMDYTSCNGVVNFDNGCVLFNERSQAGANLSPLIFSANNTAANTTPIAGNPNDSNTVIKVTPDRFCSKWLACRSYIKDEKGNNVCFDIGLCDAVNENGDCSNFLQSSTINQAIDNLGWAKISNLSGYSKVGTTGGSLIADYYPLGAMRQVGNLVNLTNGNFEFYNSDLYPIGWNWENPSGKLWDTNVFSVINNPISAQTEGIAYAREGQSFLKLGSSYRAVSEGVDVLSGSTTYIITAYVNTKNLKSGTARIDILNSANGVIASGVIQQGNGKDWEFKLGTFTVGGNQSIKIRLYAYGVSTLTSSVTPAEGNFYFDDIKIRPALNSRVNWHTNQSCRLYPKTDSLSCDYYEDSGARQKGWYGYCLEYDRAPGDPNTCLLWYPVDKVQGDGIEEGAGYSGKIPVYYCSAATALVPLEYRKIYGYLETEENNSYNFSINGATVTTNHRATCTNGYTRVVYWCREDTPSGLGGGDQDDNFRSFCVPTGTLIKADGSTNNYTALDWNCNDDEGSGGLTNTAVSSQNGWYIYDGYNSYRYLGGSSWNQYTMDESLGGVKFYDPATGKVYDDIFAYCSNVVQTVNSVGDNKYWASRVYKGSDWKVYFGGVPVYNYTSFDEPFGSILAPSNNPYEWDGDSTIDGNQPLQVKNANSDNVQIASPYRIISPSNQITGAYYGICNNTYKVCYHIPGVSYNINKTDCNSSEGACTQVDFSGSGSDKLRLLFAQSYGSWRWSGTRYEVDSDAWALPTTPCSGNVRSDLTSYCYVTPSIIANSVKVNGYSSVTLTNSGFVNLTFNTQADSNQLPLTMYAIYWGDGEITTVSGVEMRDRPAGSPPHSMYHLYSYWDLRNKNRCSGSTCTVSPSIIITDNWGKSSGLVPSGVSVTVKEN